MMDRDAVAANLSDLKEAFKLLPRAVWYLHYGSALGAFIDGEPILDDHDIDIGINAETCRVMEFARVVQSVGFTWGGVYGDAEYPTVGNTVWFSKRGITIDGIWMYLREVFVPTRIPLSTDPEIATVSRKRWWLTAPRNAHVLPAYLFDAPQPVAFAGVEVPAPHPLEAFCSNMWKKVEGAATRRGIYPSWVPGVGPPGGEELHFFPEWPIYDDQKEAK